jgi:hypothetical protein
LADNLLKSDQLKAIPARQFVETSSDSALLNQTASIVHTIAVRKFFGPAKSKLWFSPSSELTNEKTEAQSAIWEFLSHQLQCILGQH